MSGWTRRAMSFSGTCGIYVRLQNMGRPSLFMNRLMPIHENKAASNDRLLWY